MQQKWSGNLEATVNIVTEASGSNLDQT